MWIWDCLWIYISRGHDDDAKLVPVETAAKPESKVSLASGCPG